MHKRDLAGWLDGSLETVSGDVARARSLFDDASGRLIASFERLKDGLGAVTPSASQAVSSIEVEINAAIAALQFQDMLDQALDGIRAKLGAVRCVCSHAAADAPDLASAVQTANAALARSAVTQAAVDTGDVELF